MQAGNPFTLQFAGLLRLACTYSCRYATLQNALLTGKLKRLSDASISVDVIDMHIKCEGLERVSNHS